MIYFFFPLFLFVSVYVCVSVCDFVCTALLLPFVLGFCLSIFGFFFSPYYLKKILFLDNYFLFFIVIILFYFILFFLLLSFFFLLPFILSRVEDRLLVLQPGVTAVPLRWERQVQDPGPQETSKLHVISNSKKLPEISISTRRPSSTQRPTSDSAGHPMTNT